MAPSIGGETSDADLKRGLWAMTEESLTLENIEAFVGRELGVSDWLAVDQQRINQFADCTDDHQWIHVDVERARRESPFGTTVAHGYLTLSLLPTLQHSIGVMPAGVKVAINYGLDKARFITPVPAGARIRDRAVLAAVEAKGAGRTLVTMRHTVEIEGQEKPALVADTLTMFLT
jgi:acyl dehydratase